jgi:hypothetical protein
MKLDWDFSELIDFADNLGNLPKFQQELELATKEIAAKLHKMLIKNTPVDFGTLQAFWQTGENYSYMVTRKSNGFEVTLINRAIYALWVNDGHRQRPGRFIPGYWEGNKFRYDKDADGGMVLKKSWVKGKFFVEIAIVQLIGGQQIEQVVNKHLQKWWNSL